MLVIVALIGSSLGAFVVLRNKTNQPAVIPGGQAYYLSSGQLDPGSAQGIADQLQIQLQNIPDPQAGKSYYAWLLADRHPHVEQHALEPPLQFTLPLLLGKLPVSHGSVSFFYKGDAQLDNLFASAPGPTAVVFELRSPDGTMALLQSQKKIRVSPELAESVRMICGDPEFERVA